jgi:hemerythrin-like domain-containing protein
MKMNVIKLLKEDHQKALGLIEQIEKADEALRPRTRLLNELKDSLSVHTKVEERVFYSVLEKFGETHALVDGFYREHQEVNRILAKLDDLKKKKSSDEWQDQLHKLRWSVEHHINEEEKRLFPRAEKLLGKERLSEMFYECQRIKSDQSETDSLIYPAGRLGVRH